MYKNKPFTLLVLVFFVVDGGRLMTWGEALAEYCALPKDEVSARCLTT